MGPNSRALALSLLAAAGVASLAPESGSASVPQPWQGEIEIGDAGADVLAAAVYAEDLASGAWTIESVAVQSP